MTQNKSRGKATLDPGRQSWEQLLAPEGRTRSLWEAASSPSLTAGGWTGLQSKHTNKCEEGAEFRRKQSEKSGLPKSSAELLSREPVAHVPSLLCLLTFQILFAQLGGLERGPGRRFAFSSQGSTWRRKTSWSASRNTPQGDSGGLLMAGCS